MVQLGEKTLEEVEYDEVGQNAVQGQMGFVKVAAHGMRGFYGCLAFSIVCLGVGVPILVVATFVDQWEEFECVRGAATDLTPCTGTGASYFCPITVSPTCSADFPSACASVAYNTTGLSEAEQLTW